jgi:Xaa-Pro aminopeptidase
MRIPALLPALLLASLHCAFAAAPPVAPDTAVYAARRAKLQALLPPGAIAVLNAAPEAGENTVYRPDSSFWYLTGWAEAQSIAMLLPGAAAGKRYTLFVQPKNPERERWTGVRAGPALATTKYGADIADTNDAFPKQMLAKMRDATSLWYYDGSDGKFRDTVLSAWAQRTKNSTTALPAYNLAPTIAEMRLYKDPTEVALLRHAVDLSVEAHLAALPLAQPGKGEWALHGAMVGTCLSGAAARMAYPPIVGSGSNSTVLHYDAANQVLQSGAMIVNDTACEYGMYAADITRSYPAGGVFSSEQTALYNIVLAAQKAGEVKSVTGARMHEIFDATADVIVDGLLRLGIMQGDKADILAKRSYLAFYPHGSSHWIGLDVHDAGSYERTHIANDAPPHLRNYAPAQARLKPGMAYTIEPGIYIPHNTEGVDPKWWNIGIRIEDDYLVTDKGVECLSCTLPRDIPALEKLIRQH